MRTRIINSKLFKRLKDKKYRDVFVAGEVRRLIPFQLRALRAAREMTQAGLGREARMPQTVISRIENGNGNSLNLKTLIKLASALDVALVVRFEPIDRLVNWIDNLAPEAMSPRSSAEIFEQIEKEQIEKEQPEILTDTAALERQRFRALSPTATGAVQTTMTFDSPKIAPPAATAAASVRTGAPPFRLARRLGSFDRRRTANAR